MKKVLFVLGQLLLLALFLALSSPLAIFFLSIWTGIHAQWFISHPTPTSLHFFVPTGLLAISAVYLVIVGVEALMKRRRAALWTTAVWLLGVAAAVAFGWVTRDLS